MRGTKIGRYELLHKIAAGGMAEIFLARQWGQGGFFRDVVIKRLFPHFAEHEHALRMFQDEARLLAELSHPNIPQVHDLGFADGYWYLAMEHVGGVSLADLCLAAARVNRPLPHPVAIGIIHQVSLALHHAHERCDREGRPLRIVHRDVTPQNIMISLDAVVKVLDFGVAQTSARIDTDAGAVRGTYAYMAPEQVRGRPLDKRADVFALGINLYELTTGRRLFRGTDVEVMTAVVERDVPPPSQFVPNYPPDLEEIVMTALHRDRARRTPSAAHLALALDRFCMRHGVVIGSLVISHFVRSLFPYQRAHEAGMGIAHPQAGGEPAATDLEARLMAEELRTLAQSEAARAAGAQSEAAHAAGAQSEAARAAGAPGEAARAAGAPGEVSRVASASGSDRVTFTGDASAGPGASTAPAGGAPQVTAGESVPEGFAAESTPPFETGDLEGLAKADGLGLDAFDEDSDVKPVVLLSPKAKTGPEEGAFLGDLERRLRDDDGD